MLLLQKKNLFLILVLVLCAFMAFGCKKKTPTVPSTPPPVDPSVPIYVAPEGTEDNSGTSIESPTTLEKAIAMVSPGGGYLYAWRNI